MALTDWPLVILVVEVTEKNTENSQPSLRNRGNVCGIHTSLIMVCQCHAGSPASVTAGNYPRPRGQMPAGHYPRPRGMTP